MKYSIAFSSIMSDRGYTQQEVADSVGVSQPALANSLRRGDPRLSSASRYLEPMGYRVALVPVGAKLPKGSYVLD